MRGDDCGLLAAGPPYFALFAVASAKPIISARRVVTRTPNTIQSIPKFIAYDTESKKFQRYLAHQNAAEKPKFTFSPEHCFAPENCNDTVINDVAAGRQ